MLRILFYSLFLLLPLAYIGQKNTNYSSILLANGHSNNTLNKKNTEIHFRYKSCFFNNKFRTNDIGIGLNYGLTNKLLIGGSVNNGASVYKKLISTLVKYKLLENKINITILSNTSFSAMPASKDPSSPVSFSKNIHRFAYTFQSIISKNLNKKLYAQITPSITHRNYVAFDDENTIISLGFGAYYSITNKLHIISEYFINTPSKRMFLGNNYYNPITIGLDYKINNSALKFLVTNASGLTENQYLPYSDYNLKNKEFIIGLYFSHLIK